MQLPHRLVLLLHAGVLEYLVGAQHLAHLDLPAADGGKQLRHTRLDEWLYSGKQIVQQVKALQLLQSQA